MKIYEWGGVGSFECVLAESAEESWDRLSDSMKDYFDNQFYEDNCNIIELVDGKFGAYAVWEFEE